MEDPQAILYLLAFTDAATEALSFPENSHRVLKLPTIQRHTVVGLQNDEGTQDGLEDITNATRECSPCDDDEGRELMLRLGFDDGSGPNGFVFGRDESCDVKLARSNRCGISNKHFRVHFNLTSGVLLLSDTSKYGTTVGNRLLKHESIPLIADTHITCGFSKAIAFEVRLQDYSSHKDVYRCNFEGYAKTFGFNPTSYLPTPGMTPFLRPIGPGYSILETIGSGAFGLIHTAVLNKNGRIFAAKEIRCRLAAGRPLMPTEVEIFSRTSHVSKFSKTRGVLLTFHKPHIVAFVDTVLWNQKAFVLMEYIERGNLLEYQNSMTRQRIAPAKVRLILSQSLDALAYLHAMGITHRDMKPENILVTSFDPLVIKLADFGLSSQKKDPTTFCGTPGFLAPEVYEASLTGSVYDSRVDIWGLGAVGFKALGGLPKHRGGRDGFADTISAQPQYYKDIKQALNLGRQCGTPLLRLLRRMLAQGAHQRPSAVECLEDPWLAQAITHLQTQKRAISFSPVPEVPPTRRRRIDDIPSLESADTSERPVTYPSEGVYHLRLPSQ